MATATSKTRDQFPLSTKKILKKTITSSLVWVFLYLFFIVPFAFVFINVVNRSSPLDSNVGLINGLAAGGTLILLLLIIALTYFYQKWYFEVYFYDLTPDYIIIKKGPITPREITIPYERVQDVYVDQDLFDRFFGLYDVHLSSATISSGMEAHIDGVEKIAAEGLRGFLLKTVTEKITRAKNPSQGMAPVPSANI